MSAITTLASTETTATAQLSAAITGLEPDSAKALREAFEAMFAQADEWCARARSIVVTSEDQKHEMRLARESRLALRQIRINTEKTRKRLKEDSLRRGRAIDGVANIIKALIEPIEAYLLEQEQFAERAQAARRKALADARAETLRAYDADPADYADLGLLSEERWQSILESARVAHEAKREAARLESEKREAERLESEKREAERLESEKREAAEAAEKARRAAVETDAAKPTRAKYMQLVAALNRIASWGRPLEELDEPWSAAVAREALEAVGLGEGKEVPS